MRTDEERPFWRHPTVWILVAAYTYVFAHVGIVFWLYGPSLGAH